MSLSLRNVLLLLTICRILPSSLSLFVGPEDDSEWSGYDEGGSGFDSVEDGNHPKRLATTTNIRVDENGIVRRDGGDPGAKLPFFKGDSHLMIDSRPTPGHVHHVGPAVFSVEKLKTLLKSKEGLAGAVAGGAMGLVLAVAVAAVMIYKWKMKDAAYTLGKPT